MSSQLSITSINVTYSKRMISIKRSDIKKEKINGKFKAVFAYKSDLFIFKCFFLFSI